jgi:hypothetical protein
MSAVEATATGVVGDVRDIAAVARTSKSIWTPPWHERNEGSHHLPDLDRDRRDAPTLLVGSDREPVNPEICVISRFARLCATRNKSGFAPR